MRVILAVHHNNLIAIYLSDCWKILKITPSEIKFESFQQHRVLGWIALKFGALLEHIKAYLRFNFCSNGIKKHGVIIDFQNF